MSLLKVCTKHIKKIWPGGSEPCCNVSVCKWTPDLVDIADDHVSSDGAEGPPCLVSWAVHSFVEVYSIADVHAKEAVPFYVSSTSIYATHVAVAKTSTWLACCADACWQTSTCWQAKDMGLLPDVYGVAFRDCNCRLSDKQIKLTGPVTNMWLFLYWFGELLMEALRLLQTWLHKWLFGWCLVHNSCNKKHLLN